MKNKFELQRWTKTILNMVVTFFEVAGAFWYTSGFKTDKLVISGAVGAGLSAVYNLAIKPFLKAKGWIQ